MAFFPLLLSARCISSYSEDFTQICEEHVVVAEAHEAACCIQLGLNAVNRSGGCYNWDNNITTKTANKSFDLTILANDTLSSSPLKDTNITKLELLSFSDALCTTQYATETIWNDSGKSDIQGCFEPTTAFTHTKAIKCAKIRVYATHDDNDFNATSSDTFSIKPDRFEFIISQSGKLIAQRNYTVGVKALEYANSNEVEDYNITILPASNKYFRNGSDGLAMAGSFVPSTSFAFANGVVANTTLSFDNVGIIGLELNDTTWSEVDSDDTPLVKRRIYLEENLSFIPDRFDINFTLTPTMKNYDNKTFTYYADDTVNMGANLKNLTHTITALGKDGAIMTNYQNPQTTYFANDIDFLLNLNIDQNPTLLPDINENVTKDLNFTGGVATLTYSGVKFNFGREKNVSKNPLLVDGTNSDINITTTDSIDSGVKGDILQTFENNATFYYGKIQTKDIKTAISPTTESLITEVYWDGSGSRVFPSTFVQNTTSWYTNVDDDTISTLIDGDFTPMNKRKIETPLLGVTISVDSPNPTNGEIGYTITKSDTTKTQKVYYHVDIPIWLWYSRYEDYNFSTDSTCASHPCFEYIFEAEDTTSGIKSGNFKGSKFDNNFDSKIEKKAIKLMR